jgi:hypothetical protein
MKVLLISVGAEVCFIRNTNLPAISNGLSFNKKTGTISGAPIVAADPVTYVITAST